MSDIITPNNHQPTPAGIDKDRVMELLDQVRTLLDAEECNYTLVIEGATTTMCQTNSQIPVTKATDILQVLTAGVLSGKVDAEERHILEAVATVVREKFYAEEDQGPKIILN